MRVNGKRSSDNAFRVDSGVERSLPDHSMGHRVNEAHYVLVGGRIFRLFSERHQDRFEIVPIGHAPVAHRVAPPREPSTYGTRIQSEDERFGRREVSVDDEGPVVFCESTKSCSSRLVVATGIPELSGEYGKRLDKIDA